jgi:hypothetical protein
VLLLKETTFEVLAGDYVVHRSTSDPLAAASSVLRMVNPKAGL